jgi:Subtilase family
VPHFSGLLVKVRGNGSAFARATATAFGATSVKVQPILRVPAAPADSTMGFAATPATTWLSVEGAATQADHPWDAAHRLLAQGQDFAAAGSNIEAIEPNLAQGWFDEAPQEPQDPNAILDEKKFCTFDPQDESGNQASGPGVAWNFNKTFSQLSPARQQVGDKLSAITIAHLDTGFDPDHITRPVNLAGRNLQRNFVSDGFPIDDASDHTPPGFEFARNRGHGTGTLSLLAGNRLDGHSPGWTDFEDFVGVAPTAKIIPVRIADWVVRFTTGTMVQGFGHAHATGAHVLSMSMGGVSSQALVDAVNLAYDAGIVMVTAAGNNFAWLPSPKSIVFPARLRRVLAACGVMADGRAYADLAIGTMQGNYGPSQKMDTALGAYTPNVPWAQIACGKVVDMNGRGTSAATPQIAGAAALWLAEHWDTVKRYSQPWMRVEAVRQALFQTALKVTARMGAAETREKIGQGVLRAETALAFKPPAEANLAKLPPAQATWSWLDLLLGSGGVSFAVEGGAMSQRRRRMLALELTQMAQRHRKIDEAIDDPDRPPSEIPAAARNRYLEAALDEGNPSKPLRAVLEAVLGRRATVGSPPRPKAVEAIKRKTRVPPTPKRRLRVYALDPSIGKRLSSIDVNETTLYVPWEENLQPGPIGEYLEVIDVDPASDRAYEPVDLNDQTLLAQDGWAPSEGNPQFHQQMVYAVAMTTIGHFEKAIGRKALWAPHVPGADEVGAGGSQNPVEVPRLRIYPHALRTDNAYYSPSKKALLLGYFQSNAGDGTTTPAGSMVFTCLSSDIVAHETTHALLDGMHRRFEEASNLDVPAFHEGFADIVALFQHFTMPELVRFEIELLRGDLMQEGLLAGLASQFGEASGRRGPLRNYVHADPKVLHYPTVEDAHDRGSILVYAVYDAFRMIVDRRTKDLVRLATGGSGLLAPGAIHPDLVQRLTDETCKTASQVLRMCIRALDYCPTVDITFGDYLRAVITADLDVVRDDRLNYRIAFMESFRKWNILPPNMRTVSEQTLAWNTPDQPCPEWIRGLVDMGGDIGPRRRPLGADVNDGTDQLVFGWNRNLTRSQIFDLNEDNRWRLWRRLKKTFDKHPELYKEFGLMAGVSAFNRDGTIREKRPAPQTTFEVHSVRLARRVTPDGDYLTNVIAAINQRQAIPLDGKDVANGFFWFRGGATLIIDPSQGAERICYSIIKNSGSKDRLDQQKQLATGSALSSLRALYFGGDSGLAGASVEPFAMMHADRGDSDNG